VIKSRSGNLRRHADPPSFIARPLGAGAISTYHFLHIPKTGGTSVTDFLRTQIPEERIYPGAFDHQIVREPEDAPRFDLYAGHISIGRAPGDPRLITMLRNPRQRLLSAFGHWRAVAERKRDSPKPGNGFVSQFLEMSLEEFLAAETPALKRVTMNLQSRLLAGGQYGTKKSTRAQVFGPELGDEEALEAATHTLRNCFYFGFTEDLNASIQRLAALGGWPHPETRYRSKVTPSWARPTEAPEISEDKLKSATSLDDRLYAAAKDIYRERFGG
tara:strand:- start:7566 stop:8384 length:819 start_codon:yes stop_codon:yes gene_type:complete